MKNLLIVIIVSLLIIGCGKNDKPVDKKTTEKPDTSGILNVSKDDAPPSTVNLIYQLKKDNSYLYRLTSLSTTLQNVISDSTIKNTIKQSITYVFKMDVNEVESDNVMDIKINIQSVKLDATANGQKYKYESGTKLDSTERLRYLEYEAVLNNPFSIRLDSKGEILEVYRLDKIVNKFLSIQGVLDSVTAAQKKEFQTNIAETAIKPLLQQVFRILPSKNVGKDSVWSNQYGTRLSVFDVTNIAKYKLKDFAKLEDNRLAVIDAGLEIIARGKNKVSEQGVNYDFKTPEATGSGTIYFDLTKGCVVKAKTTSKLKMSMTMQMPKSPRGPMKATRNDYVENTNVLELL
jgi:hypothetical protein